MRSRGTDSGSLMKITRVARWVERWKSWSKVRRRANGSTYQCNTTTWPVRGKGPHSPETEYGADAVIEIVLRDEFGETVASKILPIQNKKEKIYSNRTLAKQADRLSKLPGGGLIRSSR